MTILHGFHVTDIPDVAYTWDIDTSEVIEMLYKVLEPLRLVQRKENVQDMP